MQSRHLSRAIICICAGLIIASVLLGVIPRNQKGERRAPIEAVKPTLILDVAQPERFIDSHLRHHPLPTSSSGWQLWALDGERTVRVTRGSQGSNTSREMTHVDFPVLLISCSLDDPSVEHGHQTYTIVLVGESRSIESTIEKAYELCEVVGIENVNLKQWFEKEGYRDSSGLGTLESGVTEDGVRHTISIQESLSLDQSMPWTINYSLIVENK